jgi:hypothetical protein
MPYQAQNSPRPVKGGTPPLIEFFRYHAISVSRKWRIDAAGTP